MDLRQAAKDLITYKDDVRECNRRGIALATMVLAEIKPKTDKNEPEVQEKQPKTPEKPTKKVHFKKLRRKASR